MPHGAGLAVITLHMVSIASAARFLMPGMSFLGAQPGLSAHRDTGELTQSAAALARRLQPSMVVLEDIDLIAMDRDFSEGSNPLLFTLLDAMDGIGSDADVTFVLTTNRADILEHALADRPGRVDLAIEIPRPNLNGRVIRSPWVRGRPGYRSSILAGDWSMRRRPRPMRSSPRRCLQMLAAQEPAR